MTLSDDYAAGTELQEFYRGASVFITGGTGFLGKALVEKLLRSLPHLNRIFLLIREKKGKDVESRTEELFEDPVYDLLKSEVPKFQHKVIPVVGDCLLPGLGLSEVDKQRLIEEVNIIFHVAATVRFDEKLRIATRINVLATEDILALAREMPHLKAVIHVSTAYAHCNLTEIKEEFYEPPLGYKSLFSLLDSLTDDVIDESTPKLLQSHPNTYNFTKAIAEDLIKNEGSNLPVGIFRPALIVSSSHEPFPGWIDNYYGPTGMMIAVGIGLLRVVHANPEIQFNLIPVDMTVNSMIAAAWDVSTSNKQEKNPIPIYNFVSSTQNPITLNKFMNLADNHVTKVPSTKSIWYPAYTLTQSKIFYTILCFMLHTLPALVVDFIMMIVGKKPRLMKVYKKIHNVANVLLYFTNKNWNFVDENVQKLWNKLSIEDKRLFNFNIKDLDWSTFVYDYICGCRVYLLKDDLKTIPEGKIRHRRLYWLHQAVKISIVIVALRLFWFLVSTMIWFLR